MGIQKEIWTDYISKNLWKNNDFLLQSADASQHVLAGKVVHIANAGNPAGVVRNRTVLPATVVKRADVDITYNLDEYTTNPTLIENAEQVELSYDKVNDVLGDVMASLRQELANWMLYNWVSGLTLSDTLNRVKVTGSAAATWKYAPDVSANMTRFTVDDIRKAAKLLDKNDVPGEDRYCLLDAEAYDQLLEDMKPSTYKDFSSYFDAATGVVGNLYGFTFYKRSTVLYANSSFAVLAPSATSGRIAGAGICWQKQMVERAVGTVDFFENLKDATYFGDIYSGLVRAGGRNRRNDGKGIVVLMQTT